MDWGWVLADPNDKACNAIVVNDAEKVQDRLRLYDHSITSKNCIKNELDLVKLKELTAVKGNAFTVFFDTGVLKDEHALFFLHLAYTRTCLFEKVLKNTEHDYGEQTQTQQCNQGYVVV